MRAIGSRELKAHLGEVLRQVRERQEVYAVTHRGRTIARLIPEALARAPLDSDSQAPDFETLWSEMDQLAAEIGQEWPEGVSAAQAVSEDRREL
jgi:prevent-host-death family protein